ncbi:hypothetical protein KL930_002217 [Ogataea haglerorum]|uniref:Uncharacterized protein n=1 Tax=Ogataea haglerorum TaxID=1937702 RepID=A0AAN6D8B5_9ASCO|nr:hypothetical protein KL933_001866 [Ogataea haglerorum]KAG7779572.1 hypothetical protein KL930_002217 [Ogataea haglerorum]KAG7779818.1 hypothetical protein KL922_001103 [Ogataea haglerorum]
MQTWDLAPSSTGLDARTEAPYIRKTKYLLSVKKQSAAPGAKSISALARPNGKAFIRRTVISRRRSASADDSPRHGRL